VELGFGDLLKEAIVSSIESNSFATASEEGIEKLMTLTLPHYVSDIMKYV